MNPEEKNLNTAMYFTNLKDIVFISLTRNGITGGFSPRKISMELFLGLFSSGYEHRYSDALK